MCIIALSVKLALYSQLVRNMKFTVDQSILNDVLTQASKAIPAKALHPVLTCFLVEVESTQEIVSITGFNLSLSIAITFKASVLKGGTTAVPAQLLMDIVSRLPDGELTFEVAELMTVLTSSSGSYEVRGMCPDEYPEIPAGSNTIQRIVFDPERLAVGIKNTLFAASTDEAKQVLNGVHLQLHDKKLELAATDGHRLGATTIFSEDLPAESEFAATIPLRAMKELERLLYKRTEPVILDFSSEQLLVEVEAGDRRTRMTARCLQGDYPNYKQLIPSEFQRKLVIDRKLLLASIERVSVFAIGKVFCCIFAVSGGEDQQINLSTEAQDIGFGRETIPAQVLFDDDVTFGFNIKYLLDILRTAQSNEIELCANAVLAPVVFRPVGDENVIFLMMPTQLRRGNNESTKA